MVNRYRLKKEKISKTFMRFFVLISVHCTAFLISILIIDDPDSQKIPTRSQNLDYSSMLEKKI